MNDSNFEQFKDTSQKVNVKAEILKYLHFWHWFVIGTAITLTGIFLLLRYTPDNFVTTSSIKILEVKQGLAMPSELSNLFGRSTVVLDNEIEVIKSHRLLKKVVKSLNLNNQFFAQGRVITTELWNVPFQFDFLNNDSSLVKTKKFDLSFKEDGVTVETGDTLSILIKTKAFDKHPQFRITVTNKELFSKLQGKTISVVLSPESKMLSRLSKMIQVTKVNDRANILVLSIIGENKNKNEDILNSIVTQFNLDGVYDRQLVYERTISFVDDRFVYLAKELDSIEVNKKDYKTNNNISFIESDAALSLQNKQISNKEVYALETQIVLTELMEESLLNDNELLPSSVGISDGSINLLINKYNDKLLIAQNLLAGVGESHPSYIQLTRQIGELRNNIAGSIGVYKKQLNASLEQLEIANNKVLGQFAKLPENEKLLRSIEREQIIKESLYLLLLQKREEAAINLAVTAPSIKIVDYAITDPIPVSPKRNIFYLVGLLLGVFIPFGLIYIKFELDNKLHSKQDLIDAAPNVPVVGEIPLLTNGETMFVNKNERSVLAETFRILSTNLNYLFPHKAKDDKKGVVAYTTSTIKGEGKTFISLNLAFAFAHMNKKVLLVGADLRNPQLHTYLNISKSVKGLAQYLHNHDVTWQDCIHDTGLGVDNFEMILSGAVPPNPTELLSSSRFEQFIEEAKEVYDLVLIDTAPTLLVTDTLLISKFAELTLFVTRANKTELNLLEYSKGLYKEGKIKNMAYVINCVGDGKSNSYKYGYNYGYGYGYGENAVKKTFLQKIFKS